MPTICTFFGILIQMYFNDHEPPHFHAIYAGDKYIVGISPIGIRKGQPSPRVRSMLLEWTAIHQTDLLANWERVRADIDPVPVEPLE